MTIPVLGRPGPHLSTLTDWGQILRVHCKLSSGISFVRNGSAFGRTLDSFFVVWTTTRLNSRGRGVPVIRRLRDLGDTSLSHTHELFNEEGHEKITPDTYPRRLLRVKVVPKSFPFFEVDCTTVFFTLVGSKRGTTNLLRSQGSSILPHPNPELPTSHTLYFSDLTTEPKSSPTPV